MATQTELEQTNEFIRKNPARNLLQQKARELRQRATELDALAAQLPEHGFVGDHDAENGMRRLAMLVNLDL
jgi:hypothetical protein